MINIVIVEDSFDAREGFRYLLSLDSEIRVLNTYENAEALLDSAEVLSHTDVVLMDIELPGMSGIEATRIITETYRDTD
ncbi:MAG: response regulator, partial [Sphaerochaetaceae bacterium]